MPACSSLLSITGYLHWSGFGGSWKTEKLPSSCLAMPCCCGAEGLPVPLLSQIQQGMGAVICSPPRCCSSQTSACVDLLPATLSAPAPQVANPPAKGPKSRFDGQTTKAMLKTIFKILPPTTRSKKIHISPIHSDRNNKIHFLRCTKLKMPRERTFPDHYL